jgi:hypothetical protein
MTAMLRRLAIAAVASIVGLALLAAPASAATLRYDSAAFFYPGEYRSHSWGEFGENVADSDLNLTVQAKYDSSYRVHYYRLDVSLSGDTFADGYGPVRYELDRVSLVSSSGATVFSRDANKLGFHGSLHYVSPWGSTCGCKSYRSHVVYFIRWPDGTRIKRDYYSGWVRGIW